MYGAIDKECAVN